MGFKPGESGNPGGRPPKGAISERVLLEAARTLERFDSWTNFYTGMGTHRDKRTFSWFSPDIVTDTEALNLWRGDDICKRVIEGVPKTAFRRGFTLKVEDKELAEQVQSDLEDIDFVGHFVKACQYENAYGGAALFPVTDDIVPLEQPLDENNIGKIHALHLLEPRELTPIAWDTDLRSKTFRQPIVWRLMPIGGVGGLGSVTQYVHTSRLIIFPGRRVSNQIQAYQRPGWGDSNLTGIYPIIRDFGSAWGHAAALLEDFAQATLAMDGYAELMKENGGEAFVKARLQMLDMMRSTMRLMVVDAKDKYSRETTPMGGLSDLLHDFMLRVAAAAEQPVTVLFGMEPAGLAATGDNDVRGWYDTVAAWREHHVKPRLDRGLHLYFMSKEGATGGVEPDMWSTEFPALWEPTEKEVAETRFVIAQTDKIYAVDIQACTADDVAESRWKGDTFSPEMTINWERRAAQQKAADDMAAQQLELEQAQAEAAKVAAANGPDGSAPSDGSQPPPTETPPAATVAGRKVKPKTPPPAAAEGAAP